MICSGANGTLFEVTPEKEIVWKYVNPAKGGFGGPGGRPAAAEPGAQPLPAGQLDLTPDQRKEVDGVPEGSRRDAELEKTLSDEQKKKLKQATSGPGGFTLPGQILLDLDADPAEADRRAEEGAGRPPEGGRRQAREAAQRRQKKSSSR